MGRVAALDTGSEQPALDRLGQDHGRRALGLGRSTVRGVDLLVVEAAAAQLPDLLVAHVRRELAETGIGSEEVLADESTVFGLEALVLAVDRRVHLVDEHPVEVVRQQRVPVRAPDDLDHVPPRAAEHGFEFLDDFPVAPHRSVEALQVGVDDPNEVVEFLARRKRDRPESFGLVRLAVADETPHPGSGGVVDAPVVQVLEELRLVDRVDRPEPHRNGRILPELGHESGVGIARQPAADLSTEPVEVAFIEAVFHERPGVDPWCGVTLDIDGIAGGTVLLAAEEVVETDLVQHCRRREGRQVPADARRSLVRLDDHHRGVPADETPDPALEVLVAGEPRLGVG